MINQIGNFKLNIDQQTGVFCWDSKDVKIYATRNSAEGEGFVELKLWAIDINGNEFESDGEGFFLSSKTRDGKKIEYYTTIMQLVMEIETLYFWDEGVQNLDRFLGYVFTHKINKFLTK